MSPVCELNNVKSVLPLTNPDKLIGLTSTPLFFSNIKSLVDNVPPVTNVFVSVSPVVPTTTLPIESIPKLFI